MDVLELQHIDLGGGTARDGAATNLTAGPKPALGRE